MADSDAPTLQIIDQDGKFNTDLKDFMQSNGLMSSGLSYGAVSIIGGQGSGKSTLLNALFGTSFATMTAQRGRSQTTQGIWCSKARDMNIFVLDVEGTDGREAQDDKKAFENKSALLSLALTDVLMVNLWEKEVGRFQAANLPLLRTVFEVHLRLLNSSSGPMKMSQKPLLMFILRDCDGRTPAHELHDTLRLDLEGIWTEIVKPAGHESSVLWDFFELRSIPLPHYVHQFEDWKLVVDKLHNTFADKSDGQFVFQGRDDKAVPADGFADYAEQLWLAIEAEGDLDLPSQRKLLAQFRCRAKVAELLALFDQESVSFIKARTESIPPSLEAARAGVERLLATGRELVDRMVAQYDAETAGYDPTVKEEEKSTLTDTMWSRLHPAFDAKISFCIMLLGDQFTEALGKKLSAKAAQPVALAVEWNALVKAQREESIAQLSALLDQVIPDGAEIWDKRDLLSKLSADLDRCEETSKRRLAEMMLVHTKETLRKRIGHDLSKLLDDAKLDMWTEIARSREQHLETALVTLAPAQAALSEEEDLDSKLAELATEAVHERLHERAKQRSMLDTVFRRFDAEFNREKTRGWTQFDRPAHEFKKARDTAMATFNLFTESQLPGFPSVIYIDEEARRDAEKLIDVRLMAELAWAESAKASASTRNVWFMGGWGLAIILGLDNFLWLLYNPFYLFLFLVILIGAAYYYLHQKLGSYAQVSQLALKKAGEVLANSLPQPPQPAQPPVGTPTSAQSTPE